MRSTSPRSQPARTRGAAHAAALVVQRANRPLWHGRRRTERVAMPMIHGSAVRATLGRNGAGHASQSGRQDERAVLSVCRVQVRCIAIGKKCLPGRVVRKLLFWHPSFSANPPYCSLSFFSIRFHYMDFPDCLLLLLSISVFLLFSFSVFTLF